MCFKVHGNSDLLRKQNTEKMDLERLLSKEEQEAMDNMMEDHERKRKLLMEDQGNKLNGKINRK